MAPTQPCPVREDDGSSCGQRVRVTVVVGSVFGVESYLDVCLWHAEVIEGEALVGTTPACREPADARYR